MGWGRGRVARRKMNAEEEGDARGEGGGVRTESRALAHMGRSSVLPFLCSCYHLFLYLRCCLV